MLSQLTALLKIRWGLQTDSSRRSHLQALYQGTLSPNLLTRLFLPFQFGVGTKGVAEPVIRASQSAFDNSLRRTFTHLTSLDFSNAFNTVDRREIASGLRRCVPSLYPGGKWAYGTSSDLILTNRDTGSTYTLSSAQGVHHGDPLGPLMFSLGI